MLCSKSGGREEQLDARLQEAQTAYDEAVTLYKARKYAEAVAQGEHALMLAVVTALKEPALISVAIFAAVLPYIVLSTFSAIQRAHDMDWSGWTVLLSLIPLFGLIWLFNPGTPGRNRFGAPPPPNTTGVKVGAWSVPVLFVLLMLAATVSHP